MVTPYSVIRLSRRDLAGVSGRFPSFKSSPTIHVTFPCSSCFDSSSNPSFRSRVLARFVRKPPGVLRRLGRMFMPGQLRTKVVSALNNWNSVRAPRQPMPADLRNRLTAEFTPQVNELSDLLGRDLSDWTRIKDQSSLTAV